MMRNGTNKVPAPKEGGRSVGRMGQLSETKAASKGVKAATWLTQPTAHSKGFSRVAILVCVKVP
jgi:hypothetical protein